MSVDASTKRPQNDLYDTVITTPSPARCRFYEEAAERPVRPARQRRTLSGISRFYEEAAERPVRRRFSIPASCCSCVLLRRGRRTTCTTGAARRRRTRTRAGFYEEAAERPVRRTGRDRPWQAAGSFYEEAAERPVRRRVTRSASSRRCRFYEEAAERPVRPRSTLPCNQRTARSFYEEAAERPVRRLAEYGLHLQAFRRGAREVVAERPMPDHRHRSRNRRTLSLQGDRRARGHRETGHHLTARDEGHQIAGSSSSGIFGARPRCSTRLLARPWGGPRSKIAT